jgi:hypothetical protein
MNPPTSAGGGTTASDGDDNSLSRWKLEEIVDRVVERVEQRVLDELDRRGRRWTPEVF